MPIGRGSRSILTWKEETTYGTAPGGNWNTFPVNSEGMDENINTVQGEDIRPDRANPSMRGGNIATGGNIVSDYGPVRHLTFLKHLMAASVETIPLTTNVAAATDSTAYALNTWVEGTGGTLWQVTTAGTSGSGVVAALTGSSPVTSGDAVFTPRAGTSAAADSTAYALKTVVTGPNNSRWIVTTAGTTSTGVQAALVGTAPVTSGTVVFTYLVGDLRPSVAYKRGDLVMDNTGKFWTCARGGTTDVAVTSSSLTGVGECNIGGTGVSLLKFSYFGVATSSIWRHVLTAAGDWPAGGISIEKGLKGGSSDLFVVFRGCRFNTLELTVPQEGIVKSTWGILAKNSAKLGATGAGTPVLVGEAPFTGFNCYAGLNEDIGNADRAVREFSLTMTNQADENAYVVGSRFRVEIPEGVRRASGRLSMYFQDAAEYDWFKNETTISLNMSFVWNGRMVKFTFGEVKLTGSGTPKFAGPGLLMADYEWTAFLESGTSDVIVTAMNDSQFLP